jgi:hypothetical protein
LTYVDCTAGLIHGFTPTGVAAVWGGIPVLAEEKLFPAMADFGIDLSGLWDHKAYSLQARRDLLDWLQLQRRLPTSKTDQAKQAIRAGLIEYGFSDLVPKANALIG